MTYYDVSPVVGVQQHQVSSALRAALSWGGSAAASGGRYDAAGPVAGPDTIDAYSRHVDSLVLDAMGETRRALNPRLLSEARNDALVSGTGGYPRDFEFVRGRVFEEKRQLLSAMQYFPIDTSVPLGARKHTVRRSVGAGEAQIYRRSNEIPVATNAFLEETFNVAYVVCSVEQNFIDALTTDWAGLQSYQRDMRLAVRLVEERLNRIAWLGAPEAGLPGVLTYPHLAKMAIPTAFTDATSPEDVSAALTDFVNIPMISSSGSFSPTALLVSPRLHAFLFSRKHSTTGGTDLTIGQFFLMGQAAGGAGIGAIQIAPELAGIGPGGSDGILAYRPDMDSMAHVLIQAPTTLPVFQSTPMDQTTVVFAATGGIVMPDVGNAILGFVTTT